MGFYTFGKGGGNSSINFANSILDRSITELTSNISSLGAYALGNCFKLTSLNLPEVISCGPYAMQSCTALTDISMPKVNVLGNFCFYRCRALKKVYLPSINQIGGNCFTGSGLKTLIIPYTELCVLVGNPFKDTPIEKGTGYIYVPAELAEEYKTATNWTVYSEQVRSIEDYSEEVSEV